MEHDSRIARIENKIDTICDKIGSIDSTLSAQHESLKLHIKRTNLLEAQLEPIKHHVAMVHGAFKLIGISTTVVGLIAALTEILTYIRK